MTFGGLTSSMPCNVRAMHLFKSPSGGLGPMWRHDPRWKRGQNRWRPRTKPRISRYPFNGLWSGRGRPCGRICLNPGGLVAAIGPKSARSNGDSAAVEQHGSPDTAHIAPRPLCGFHFHAEDHLLRQLESLSPPQALSSTLLKAANRSMWRRRLHRWLPRGIKRSLACPGRSGTLKIWRSQPPKLFTKALWRPDAESAFCSLLSNLTLQPWSQASQKWSASCKEAWRHLMFLLSLAFAGAK